MTNINSLTDLQRYVSGQTERYDMSCYTVRYDELVDIMTDRLLELIRSDYGFEWGDEFPDEAQIDWEELERDLWKDQDAEEIPIGKVLLHGNLVDYDACVNLMDDDIREDLHNDYAGSITEQQFLDAYIERHEEMFEREFTI